MPWKSILNSKKLIFESHFLISDERIGFNPLKYIYDCETFLVLNNSEEGVIIMKIVAIKAMT